MWGCHLDSFCHSWKEMGTCKVWDTSPALAAYFTGGWMEPESVHVSPPIRKQHDNWPLFVCLASSQRFSSVSWKLYLITLCLLTSLLAFTLPALCSHCLVSVCCSAWLAKPRLLHRALLFHKGSLRVSSTTWLCWEWGGSSLQLMAPCGGWQHSTLAFLLLQDCPWQLDPWAGLKKWLNKLIKGHLLWVLNLKVLVVGHERNCLLKHNCGDCGFTLF